MPPRVPESASGAILSGARLTFFPKDDLSDQKEGVIELLRGRLLRGLESGTLGLGDRLPSGREVASELGVDHRLVLAAYRSLAREGLVEMRQRGGVYVAATSGGGGRPLLPGSWIADVLTEGLSRSIPAIELHEWMRRCVETMRLRAAVVATTRDQVHGLCRELRDDFGLAAEHLQVSELESPELPLALRRADLIVTTPSQEKRMRAIGVKLGRPVIVVEVRPDLIAGEWALLLRQQVYVIVASAEFGEMISQYFSNTEGRENINILVVGRDDISSIPEGAPTYITQSVRGALEGVKLRGRILPPARTISPKSARELFGFIVDANIAAIGRLET